MNIKVRILKPVLITDESGPLIDISKSVKLPKVIEVHDSAFLRQAIMSRPECEFVGEVDKAEKQAKTEKPEPVKAPNAGRRGGVE